MVLEFFLKYPLELYRSGELLWTTGLEWHWWWLLGGLTSVLIATSVFSGRRTRSLGFGQKSLIVTLQLLVVALLGVVLAKPVLQIETLKPGANTVVLLVDDSLSMRLPDDREGSRLERAQALVADLEDALVDTADVVLFSFGKAAARRNSPADLTGERQASHVNQAVRDVLAAYVDVPLAAVVVVSDGADTAPLATAGSINPRIPLHTVGVGATRLETETLIEDVVLPASAPVNSRVRAQVVLRHAGGERAMVRVLEGGRLLTARSVALPGEQLRVSTMLEFDSGREGIRDLVFEVVSEGADGVLENNQLRRLLTVRQQQRNVVYLEGEPRWEYKFLRRALDGDDVVQLKSMLKTTDRKSYRQGVLDASELAQGLPEDRAELFAFDLIVLGSLGADELSDAQHLLLKTFVAERGGSLLLLAGRRSLGEGGWLHKPLADMLPVQMLARGGFGPRRGRAEVTAAGALSSLTVLPEAEGTDPWATLPMLADYQQLGALKPAATRVLDFVDEETSERLPLLVTQPYGLGTVAMLATSSTWRWQMRTPEDDPRHSTFWRQLLRQLAGQAQQPQQVSLSSGVDALAVRALLRDPSFQSLPEQDVSASVTLPDGTVNPLAMSVTGSSGALVGRANDLAPGVHRVDVAVDGEVTHTRFVRVGGSSPEYASPVQNVALLRRLAEQSGGRYWTPETAMAIPGALSYSSAGIQERQLLPLWNLPLLFGLLLALKICEWLLRRRWGRI